MVKKLNEDYTSLTDSLVDSYAQDFSVIGAQCKSITADCSAIIRYMIQRNYLDDEIDIVKVDSCIANALEYLYRASSQVNMIKDAFKSGKMR